MTVVVGVDGGGTTTRAVLVDEQGREVGRAEAPGAVVSIESPAEAAEVVARAITAAARDADVHLPAAVLWAGLAGAGRTGAGHAVEGELARRGLAARVHVGTDVEAAFHDAFAEGPGILLIAGTGSIAWARTAEGGVGRVGGWGGHLGDEGSGYAIGAEALRATVRAEDGRGPPTALRDALLERLGITEAMGLVSWVETASKGEVGALVPLVVRAAGEGDATAAAILDRAALELEAHVATMLERLGPWPGLAPLVLWGGLLRDGGPLEGLGATLESRYPVRVQRTVVDPPMGAAKLALRTFQQARDAT